MPEECYQEQQSFRYSWSYWLCLALTLLLLYGCLQQLFLQQPFGSKTAPNTVLVLVSLLMVALLAILHFSSLQLQLDQQGLAVRFIPFITQWRRHTWYEIQQIQLVSYSPLGDYGGWGIRGHKNHRCYNISGKQGLKVTFCDGKSLLIGTQQADKLNFWLEATKTTRAQLCSLNAFIHYY